MSHVSTMRVGLVAIGMLIPALTLGQDSKSQVQTAAERWDQSFNRGDSQSLAQNYTSDAVILPAGGPTISGQDNIQKFFADVIGKGFGQHKISVQAADMKGDVVIAYGRWEATGPDKKQYQGHWTNIMERQGDQWRTMLHTWN
jgi:ketosteroid isomerase-like protein